MTLTLKRVAKEDSQTTASLTTNPKGIISDEDPFIDSNRTMLARQSREPGWIAQAIMLEGQPIGMTVYGFVRSPRHFELIHFMIDHHYQNRGYGRMALALILQEMEKMAPRHDIYLTIHRDNDHARHLYEAFGFVDTDMWVNQSEKMMVRPGEGWVFSHRLPRSLAPKRMA